MRPRCLTALILVVAPSCFPSPLPLTADAAAYSIAGRERILVGAAGTPATSLEAVVDQASRDLACPLDAVRAEARVAQGVYLAEGCGKRGVYLRVARRALTDEAPGFDGKAAWVDLTRFVRISADDPASAIAELARPRFHDEAPGPGRYVLSGQTFADDPREALAALRLWTALSAQGARDLACPREEVIVELRAIPRGTTPIAEGCGRRAVYLHGRDSARPFDLASIVPINSP